MTEQAIPPFASTTNVTIDCGDSFLHRNENLFLTKIDLKATRKWYAYIPRSLTNLACDVAIDGVHYWLTMTVSKGYGFVEFKEFDPAWLNSKPAQRRYVEDAERLLPQQIFRARERLIFDRLMELPLDERRKLGVNCCLVRYDGDESRYRAHAYARDGGEVHVTEFGTAAKAVMMLREWAVSQNLYYGGGYGRFSDPASFQQFLANYKSEVAS